MTKELDGVVVKVPEGVNDQRWNLTLWFCKCLSRKKYNGCRKWCHISCCYNVYIILAQCQNIGRNLQEPECLVQPWRQRLTPQQSQILKQYLISPVRFAARAVLCLANTSLQTLLVTCDVKLRISSHLEVILWWSQRLPTSLASHVLGFIIVVYHLASPTLVKVMHTHDNHCDYLKDVPIPKNKITFHLWQKWRQQLQLMRGKHPSTSLSSLLSCCV